MTKPQELPHQISLNIQVPIQHPLVTRHPDSLNHEMPQQESTESSLDVGAHHESLLHASHSTWQARQISLLDDPAFSQPLSHLFNGQLQDSSISSSFLLPVGAVVSSPGGHFSYRILGACCRLFDREELPWPCCRIQWRSKEPSWRRIGKRFVPDLATKRFPSYMVEILDHEYSREPFVITLYWIKFPPEVQNWWYTKYVPPSNRSEQN